MHIRERCQEYWVLLILTKARHVTHLSAKGNSMVPYQKGARSLQRAVSPKLKQLPPEGGGVHETQEENKLTP